MPRVFCNFCEKGHIKVPLAVQSVMFRCPKCNALVVTITEWERQRREAGILPAPSRLPRLSAIVAEVDDAVERVRRLLSPGKPNPEPATAPRSSPPPPSNFETQLTSPHPCTQCGHGIHAPLGCDRATVVCPACSNRTSLYAVIFRCSCGVLLEAPIRREGQTDPCPACAQVIRVPADVLRTTPDELPLEAWFRFDCAECARSVAARRDDAGPWAVCPHCHSALDVPHAGEACIAPTSAARDCSSFLATRVGRIQNE